MYNMKVICDILWHSEFEWICSSAMNLWHRRTWTFGHSRSSPKTKTLLCSNACLTRAWRRWGEAVASFMLLCLVPGGFLGFKETSQILGPDAAASEILWHLDWNCQGEQHCVQRCPKCWLFVSVSFLLQPDWLPLRHPQPFVIWRCEILEPLRCHRYSISRFPVKVRVQTSVNEGFATTGHTSAEGMKSWRYYEKIWTFFAYSSCDVLQEFHLFSLKFEYNFGVSRHMYAQITEASNHWHARWDLCSM